MPRRSDSGTAKLKFVQILLTAEDGIASSCIGVAVLFDINVWAYHSNPQFPVKLTIRLNR